jgi:hypothetical protein
MKKDDWGLHDKPARGGVAYLTPGGRHGGNHRAKALQLCNALLESGMVPKGVMHVGVYHDDGCALMVGTGDCNCDPEVRFGLPGTESH